MKKWLIITALASVNAFGFPYQTNLFSSSGSISNSKPQFSWTWPRESDQVIVASLGSGATQAAVRIGRNGIWYTTVSGGAYTAGGQWTTIVPRTNLPPPATYDAEIWISEMTNSVEGATRVWAYGKVSVISSLWSSTNKVSWTSTVVNVSLPDGFVPAIGGDLSDLSNGLTRVGLVASNALAANAPSLVQLSNSVTEMSADITRVGLVASNGAAGTLDATARAWAIAASNQSLVALGSATQAQALASNILSGSIFMSSTNGRGFGAYVVTNEDGGSYAEIAVRAKGDAHVAYIGANDSDTWLGFANGTNNALVGLATNKSGRIARYAGGAHPSFYYLDNSDIDSTVIGLSTFQTSHAMTNTIRMKAPAGQFVYLVISNAADGGAVTTQRIDRVFVQ